MDGGVIPIEALQVNPRHPAPPADGSPVLPLPPRVPRVGRSRFVRWFGRGVLRLAGWKMVGEFPDLPRAMLIGAPHSSNWDGIIGFCALLGMDIDLRLVGKKELFREPMGMVMRWMRVIPIDRRAPGGFVTQTANAIRESEAMWIGIAPEGTRKQVTEWKTGFWKIAKAANVPVVLEYFHYPDRIIGIGPTIHLSDDMEADMARIRAWYAPWQGKNRGTV